MNAILLALDWTKQKKGNKCFRYSEKKIMLGNIPRLIKPLKKETIILEPIDYKLFDPFSEEK